MTNRAKIWIGEDDRELFLEDLGKDKIELVNYRESYSHGEKQIQILEGILSDGGWIRKFGGIVNRGLWVHGKYGEHYNHGVGIVTKRTGNFVIGKKSDKSFFGQYTGTHVYIRNHPFYSPDELLYLSTWNESNVKYYLGTKTLEQRMREEGKKCTAVELLGSDAEDIIWRIFVTYNDPRFVNPGLRRASPPLLLYEIIK
jgi:hypothetical protein